MIVREYAFQIIKKKGKEVSVLELIIATKSNRANVTRSCRIMAEHRGNKDRSL